MRSTLGAVSRRGSLKENIIDTPGVGADAFEVEAGGGGFAEAFFEFEDEVRDVPMERAIDALWGIREAMDFLQRQFSVLECSRDKASALGAEVACKIMASHLTSLM